MAKVLAGEVPSILKWLTPIEVFSYHISGINPSTEQKARSYLKDLLLFNLFGFIVLFLVLLLQGVLPLNPQGFAGMSWHLAFNTAVSFVTNTNWQAYSGEAALSNFSQMIGLTTQNFLSAATGLALVAVVARGLTRKKDGTVVDGSFYHGIFDRNEIHKGMHKRLNRNRVDSP